MAKFGRQIVGLAPYQRLGAGRFGEDRTAAGRPFARLNSRGQHLERTRQQGVSHQNRRRLIELLMAGRPAAAEVVSQISRSRLKSKI